MPVIDEDLERTVVKALRGDAGIVSLIKKDRNGKPGIFNAMFPSGAVRPCVTYMVNDGRSEPIFPASNDLLTITYWRKQGRGSKRNRKIFKDNLLNLFNRKGGAFDNIDEATNTGVRYAQFLKRAVDFGFESRIKLDFVEVIFEVVRSEGESFDPDDAGDQAWK